MKDQSTPNNGNLVPAGHRDLASVAAGNPLVLRGLADLAKSAYVPKYPKIYALAKKLGYLEEVERKRQEEAARHKTVDLLERADYWESCGDHEKAILDCTEHIRLFPTDSGGYYWRAKNWVNKNEYDKAVADYTEAIRLSPECPAAYRNLAQLLAACPDESVRDGNRAINIATKANELIVTTEGNEPDAWDWEILAAAYAEARRFQEAMHYQNKALEDVARYPFVNREPFLQRLELYKHKKAYRGNSLELGPASLSPFGIPSGARGWQQDLNLDLQLRVIPKCLLHQ